MKFAGYIAITLHLVVLVAVSQTMATPVESVRISGSSVAYHPYGGCNSSHNFIECCVHIYDVCASLKYSPESSLFIFTTTQGNEQKSEKIEQVPSQKCVEVGAVETCLKAYDPHHPFYTRIGCLQIRYDLPHGTFEMDFGCF